MSAYLVSRGHIRYLVEAALHLDQEGLRTYYHNGRSHYVNEITADDLGLMLWTECAKSVGARYASDAPDNLPGPIGDGPRFGYVHVPMWHHSPVPVAVLKAIRCYEYQSCEHAEWETSAAKAFCDALTHYAVSRLPGYDSRALGLPAGTRDRPTGRHHGQCAEVLMPAAWLWPDRKIGKRESRRLRDEHNATVNVLHAAREALQYADAVVASYCNGPGGPLRSPIRAALAVTDKAIA